MSERSLFIGALQIADPAARAVWLDHECGDDHALRRRVDHLLQAFEDAGSLLDRPAVAFDPTVDQTNVDRPGAVVGPYKLLEQIGEGGFGVVFLAEQSAPVRRKVALKILKSGMDTRQVVARFEAERQALAIMDHPNIARVFDGGVTAAGRPYFVMELVKGVPITEYCDQYRLPPRQRLELFVVVCHAVQHAHQKGIIHRDLKPSNVLVSHHDTTPVVKVIDFGVAKALGQELTDKTLFTGLAQMIGTPLYMSPEQAGMSDLDVDTRADVYSLGVLLYELMTGTTPFTKDRFKQAGYDEIRRIIREEEPPKPSTRLSTAEALPSIAANRGLEPRKLSGLVRGDLDWVVMKALEKDRDRRYETANGFAADVRRYLADEPVQACPPSAAYRFRKFVRRNKAPVVATSLVFLALLAGVVGASWGLVQANVATKRAEANFDLAAAAVEEYLGTVTNDPQLKQSDFYRLRQKLLKSAVPFFQKLSEQKSDDSTVEAARGRAHLRLALVHLALGEYEASLEQAEEMRAIFARLASASPGEPAHRHALANSLHTMAICLGWLGKLDEAESTYRRSLDIQAKVAADSPHDPRARSDLAELHNDIGLLLSRLGKRAEAEAAFRQAAELREGLAAEAPDDAARLHKLAQTHHNLANSMADVGKHAEAEAALRRALAVHERLTAASPADPEYRRDLASHLTSLGTVFHALGKTVEAEAAYRRGLGVHEKLAADFPSVMQHRKDLADSVNNLGVLLAKSAKHAEAEAAFRRALGLREKIAAESPNVPRHREAVSHSLNCLGNALSNMKKYSEAEAAYRKALEIKERLAADSSVPDYATDLGGGYCNFGILLAARGQPEASLPWFQKAIARLELVLSKEPRTTDARAFLRNSHAAKAEALAALGRHAEAASAREQSLRLTRDLRGPDHSHTLWAASALAESLIACDRGAEAVALIDDVLRRASGNEVDAKVVARLVELRLRHFEKKKDAAASLATAEMGEKLNRTDADSLYAAACRRAVCAAVLRATGGPDAAKKASTEADRAMGWLAKAVAAGYANAARLKQDPDLDALRSRADFQKLTTELEAKPR